MNSEDGPGILRMVQSLAPAGMLDWKPVAEKASQDLLHAARTDWTKALCVQEDDRNPDQDILTRLSGSLFEDASGAVYRDRNESMRSLASTLGLLSWTKDSHS